MMFKVNHPFLLQDSNIVYINKTSQFLRLFLTNLKAHSDKD